MSIAYKRTTRDTITIEIETDRQESNPRATVRIDQEGGGPRAVLLQVGAASGAQYATLSPEQFVQFADDLAELAESIRDADGRHNTKTRRPADNGNA